LLDIFQKNCLQIVLGTRLTDCISKGRLYKKRGSIRLSRAIMKERFRLLTLLGCTESRLSIVGVGGYHKERFKGDGIFVGGCKEGALNRLGSRSVCSCVDLRQLGAVVSC
jgi:hypothetical protein